MEGLVRGDYRVIREVGSGGMGKVYLAVHKDVPELKVIFKKMADAALFDRFKDEANSMAILEKHPNICRIRDFFEVEDGTVLAMEYIDGPTVNEVLTEKGHLTVDESLRITIGVLDALEFAHSKAIHHRDIKPGNIMIESSDGRVKVIDFGIAKAVESLRSQQTIAGHFVGTPEFMAPEQFGDTRNINWALADVYACAVTLYYMLTGQLPFKSEQIYQMLNAKVNDKPERPSRLVDGVPKQLDEILLASLEPDPTKRPQSAGELRDQLTAIRQSLHAATTAPAGEKPRKRRGKMIVGILAALAMVAVLAFVFGPDLKLPSMSAPQHEAARKAPAAPALLDPANGYKTDDPQGLVLLWKDVGQKDAVYDLDVATDSEFKSKRRIEGLDQNRWAVPPDIEPGTYYWRVRAVTDAGAGEFSGARSLTISPPAEQPPVASTSQPSQEEKPIVQGTLNVTVNEPSTILVDDSVVATNSRSFSGDVEIGDRRVTVRNPATQEKAISRKALVNESSPAELSFTFTPALTGTLAVDSDPAGADVFVDGRLVPGKKTPATIELPPGNHRIGAGLNGNVKEASVTIKAGQADKQAFTLAEGSRDDYLSARSDYESLLKKIPPGDRTGAPYNNATAAAREAASAADGRNFADATSGFKRAQRQLQSTLDTRRTDSLAVANTVSTYWNDLEKGRVDSMKALYPASDHKAWDQFVKTSREISARTNITSVQLERGDQTAFVQADVVLNYVDDRGRTNNATNAWDIHLSAKSGQWRIESMKVR